MFNLQKRPESGQFPDRYVRFQDALWSGALDAFHITNIILNSYLK